MALHKHFCVQGDLEAAAEFFDARGFGFSAAVGEEDEGDAVGAEVGEGVVGAGEGGAAAEEDAVNAGGWVSWMGGKEKVGWLLECECKLWHFLVYGG